MLRQLRGALDDFRNALRTQGPSVAGEWGGPAVADVETDAMPPEKMRGVVESPEVPGGTPAGDEARSGAIVPAAPSDGAGRRTGRVALALVAAGMAAVGLAILRWPPWSGREPADPAVVATFEGGVVTRDQLVQQLRALPPAQQGRYRSPEGLRALVGDIVIHEVTRRWAEERQVDQQEAFKEAMKHATEEIQLADVSDQLHEGRIRVGESELQAYYDQNRQRWGDRPIGEVREQVRQAVVEQKEQAFIEEYVKELKERASLQVDYTLLDVPEPTEQELAAYYQANRGRFTVPEQARIAQIQVSVSLAGGDDAARTKAESVRARVAAGEDFTQLHHELSNSPDHAQGGELTSPVARGSRSGAVDDAVFPLPLGALSAVFKEGDSYYVIKLLERWPERQRPYEEVRGEIAAVLRAERERQVYAERKDRTLFTIHARRTTLGEFVRELDELPPEARAQAAGPDGKRKLLDGLIERLLVVEDAADQATDVKRKEEVEHARTGLLARMLHQEQVDEQARVTDEEVRSEYERNRDHYADPPRAKVRYIRVTRGRGGDEDAKARAKIQEAVGKVTPSGLFGAGGAPAEFAEVARQYSEDAETAANGGLLDRWLGESEDATSELFEHALHERVLPLAVGEVSPVLALGDSYYLFQVAEKQEARQRSLEEAADVVRRELEARKHDELARTMERELMQRMQLQIYDSRIRGVLAGLDGPATETR